MVVEDMEGLYFMLISAVNDGFKNCNVKNPADALKKRLAAGEFSQVTEDEYIEVNENISIFDDMWDYKPVAKVGNVFLDAIRRLEMDDDDVAYICEALMCADRKTSYMKLKSDDEDTDHDQLFFDAIYGDPDDLQTNNKNKTGVSKTVSSRCMNDDCIDTDYILGSPSRIYEYIDKRVYGQKEAKKAAAMLLWNHVNGRRQNIVFAGPTGCGKTEIFRQLSRLYPNIVIHNATSLTGTGWKGDMKVQNLFDCDDKKQMEHLIIVLDEADKMFEDVDERRYSYMLQGELLKLMEGDVVHFAGRKGDDDEAFDIDTSNVSFVFLGSFETMVMSKDKAVNKSRAIGFGAEDGKPAFDGYSSTFTQEDLVQYANVRSEVAGRIGSIVQLYEMTEMDYYSILNDKAISPVKKLEEYYGVNLKMSARAKRKLAKEAADTGMGVRFIRSELQRKLDDKLFEDCNREEYTLV